MTDVLALDLSKRSTGWARWAEGQPRPAHGRWVLGSEHTSLGDTFLKLHRNLADQFAFGTPTLVVYEEPLNIAAAGNGGFALNQDTANVLMGLAMHVHSFCAAKGVRRLRAVNQVTWRRGFLGKMPRATKSADLKAYATERCRQFGWAPGCHDEAEALGILDHAVEGSGLLAPWRADRPLLAELGQ